MSTSAPTSNAVQCRWCGNYHGPHCSLVKAIEFAADGFTVKRVEFHAPAPLSEKSLFEQVFGR